MELANFTDWAGRLPDVPELLNKVPLSIAIIDRDLNIVTGNADFFTTLDYESQASPELVLRHHSAPHIIEKLKAALAGETKDVSELGVQTPSGIKYFDVRLFPIEDDTGQSYVAGVGCEVTDRVIRRQQQLDVEQLITVSELVNVVAHELNNPLAAVLGFSQLLQKDNLDPQSAQDAERVHESAEQCKKIVDKLLVYARKQELNSKPVNINSLVARLTAKLAGDLENARINLQVKLPSQPLFAKADYQYMRVALKTLIENARAAMPEGGTLSLEVGQTAQLADEDIPAAYVAPSEEECVEISITDTGSGIAEGIISYVFEPFFTTRPGGAAAGTGLSICRSIVRKHNGKIFIKNSSARGTTVSVQLPRHQEAPAQKDQDARKILLVDDDLACCRLLAATLSREAHLVDCAYNGTEAMMKIESEDYDVIIADIKMPYMNGMELFNTLVKKDAAFRDKLIFITGDVMGTDTRDFLQKTHMPHLMKPFDVDEVNRMVRKLVRKI